VENCRYKNLPDLIAALWSALLIPELRLNFVSTTVWAMISKTFFLGFGMALLSVGIHLIQAEESNLPPDPFGHLGKTSEIPDYQLKVDRSRGTFFIPAKEGKYVEGSHFANWSWMMKAIRWGNYFVAVKYSSVMNSKVGLQVKVGDEALLKGYAPRTGGPKKVENVIMGYAYLPENGEYSLTLLTGDKSKDPPFSVKGIEFIPAPESKALGQSIDGSIHLDAKTATTYSEKMRYEPKAVKNCLGFWVDEKDWAEWEFDVSRPGKFKVKLVQGCGGGNGGSEVAVLVDDQVLRFKVEDTGGFQNWKIRELGEVELSVKGDHKLAIKPLQKTGKAVMDVREVLLTPVEEK